MSAPWDDEHAGAKEFSARLRSIKLSEPDAFKMTVAETVESVRNARRRRSIMTVAASSAGCVAVVLGIAAIGVGWTTSHPEEDIAVTEILDPAKAVGADEEPSPAPTSSAPPRQDYCGDEQDRSTRGPLRRGAAEIGGRLADRYTDHWTGAEICWATNTLTVYRVAGSPLDDDARAVALREGFNLTLVNAPLSERTMASIGNDILRREADIVSKCDVERLIVETRPEGYVHVGVPENIACVKQMLTDFESDIKVSIDQTPRDLPLG